MVEPNMESSQFGEVEDSAIDRMVTDLETISGLPFKDHRSAYEIFVRNAQLAMISTQFFDALTDLHASLSDSRVVGPIRALEAWADGTIEFRVDWKRWDSLVDKLYRINKLENPDYDQPPRARTVGELANRAKSGAAQRWVTPLNANLYIDDILRTKFVVPFADGVVELSGRIKAIADQLGVKTYRRYHAKDSGYHAHHVYVLLNAPNMTGHDSEVVLEIKVLTKLQDTLGELTHLLYQHKRTGRIPSEKKRKLAWLFETPDFKGSYVGHSAHFIEASIVDLKAELHKLEED